ncbi:MAG: hypothetical protein V3W41_00510 [Planctomycetota bacterium]
MRDSKPKTRGFLGIFFDCCQTYGRIYANAANSHYAGHCPRCLRPIRIRIGQGGSKQRLFRAR